MRIHVIYDREGNIVSAGAPLPPAYDFQGPRFGPKAGEGQQAAELEIPEEHTGLGLAEVSERLRVDVKGKQHKLVPRGA
jgi:hypothetical protein